MRNHRVGMTLTQAGPINDFFIALLQIRGEFPLRDYPPRGNMDELAQLCPRQRHRCHCEQGIYCRRMAFSFGKHPKQLLSGHGNETTIPAPSATVTPLIIIILLNSAFNNVIEVIASKGYIVVGWHSHLASISSNYYLAIRMRLLFPHLLSSSLS